VTSLSKALFRRIYNLFLSPISTVLWKLVDFIADWKP